MKRLGCIIGISILKQMALVLLFSIFSSSSSFCNYTMLNVHQKIQQFNIL